jgi:hypothetical protein
MESLDDELNASGEWTVHLDTVSAVELVLNGDDGDIKQFCEQDGERRIRRHVLNNTVKTESSERHQQNRNTAKGEEIPWQQKSYATVSECSFGTTPDVSDVTSTMGCSLLETGFGLPTNDHHVVSAVREPVNYFSSPLFPPTTLADYRCLCNVENFHVIIISSMEPS